MHARAHEPSPPSSSASTVQRIVVVGGGIAGAEAALTMAAGLPDATVTLIGRWPSIRLLPDLVYVPFGISARRIDIPLTDLLPHGVHSHVAEVTRIDAKQHEVHTATGTIPYDVLVAAPGAGERERTGRGLRTLDDSLRIGAQLSRLVREAERGERRTITIQAGSDDSWTAPACELALLIGAWIRSHRLESRVETLLATADRDVFEWFGPVGEATVESALRRARVQVATGVPAGRFDELGGDLVVEIGGLTARMIDGLPGHAPDGWYHPSPGFEAAPDTYVIGDAIALPYRAAFATAWQARTVLRALGGDPARLGLAVDGIPNDSVEYQMDLADGVMRARIGSARTLGQPFLGHNADITLAPGARPDKLAGLLLHERVLQWDPRVHDAPLAFRDALRMHDAA